MVPIKGVQRKLLKEKEYLDVTDDREDRRKHTNICTLEK
jgi:hypothetical protein